MSAPHLRALGLLGTLLVFGCGTDSGSSTGDDAAGSKGHGSSGAAGSGFAAAGGTAMGGSAGHGGAAQAAGGTTLGGSHSAGGTASGGTGSGGLASAGSGGTGIIPHSCDDLPASGVWEKISPQEAEEESDGVVVDPFDPSIVWAGFAGHGIYKSTDCGATFTHMNTGQNGGLVDMGAPISMIVDPSNPGTIYTTDFNGASGLWKSTNGGVDFTSLITSDGAVGQAFAYNLTNSIAMNPHDSNHLIVTTHEDCKSPYSGLCVAETTDAGESWEAKSLPIPGHDGGWASGAGVYILDANTWLFTATFGVWLTTDDGASWQSKLTETTTGGKTICLPFYPSATTGHYYLSALEGTIESDDGLSWTLIPNSGRGVGFAMGDGRVYSADLWTPTYRVADESDLTTWNIIAPPADLPAADGSPYLAYDATQHILYSSNWNGGLWRVVTP